MTNTCCYCDNGSVNELGFTRFIFDANTDLAQLVLMTDWLLAHAAMGAECKQPK